MELIVKPTSSISGRVKAPPSKSYTHRAIIIASLAEGKSTVTEPLISEDTKASIDACTAIGAEIEIENNKIIIKGNSGKIKVPDKVINTKNSGTTIRIMTAVAGLCDTKITLTGDESIQKRPMRPLLDALEQLGVKTESRNGNPPVSITGPILEGICRIRGDISSQFISGLLIATPLAKSDTEIQITTELKSKPYIDLTLDVLTNFNGRIGKEDNKFLISGNQKYKAKDYAVEGDYSSSAFILGAAALTDSEVIVENLFENSKQGDKEIIEILRRMGTDVIVKKSSITVKGNGKLKGIDVDLSNSPDLVPIVAVLGSLAEGKTQIRNVGHLRYKESDRLHAITVELKKMGAKVKEGKDSLEIEGVELLKGGKLNGWNDHRIVMALAVAGLKAKEETIIDSAESIPVSFPNFVEAMEKLGVKISLEQ